MKIYSVIWFVLFSVLINAQEITDKEAFNRCLKGFSRKTCLSDEDKDGILFYLDKCPKEAGPVENSGCLLPDQDKDGVLDQDDECPANPGPAENNGCPWMDTDKDGVQDKDDACPDVFGAADNLGCPRPKKDCKKVYEREKTQYKEDLKQVEKMDFNLLFTIILEDEDFKTFFIPKRKFIFLRKIITGPSAECGNDPYYDCPHFEKIIGADVFNKLWSPENFNRFRKKTGSSTIIPVPTLQRGDGIFFGLENDENNYFVNNGITPFYKGKVNDNGRIQNIYYISPQKPVEDLFITRKDEKFIDIESVSFGIAMYPRYDTEGHMGFMIQLSFSDSEGASRNAPAKFYQFKERKWVQIKGLE